MPPKKRPTGALHVERLKYEDISEYIRVHTADFDSELKKLKDHIENEAKEIEKNGVKGKPGKAALKAHKIPIYSIKTRLKTVNSIYLKSKRKSKTSFEGIEDYAGMRVLCLFEDDLPLVHDFLVGVLVSRNYVVKEVNAYNWDGEKDDKAFIQSLNLPLNTHKVGKTVNCEKRSSGYRSIHYIVRSGTSDFPIEIQLRTLLQDVWGELEHALCYKKGDIHPHIRKSFKLFSQDLVNAGSLMSHLLDISKKEKTRDAFDKCRIVPRHFLHYESNLLPACFKSDPALAKLLAGYNKIWDGVVLQSVNGAESYVVKAQDVLDKMVAKTHKFSADKDLQYWLSMEKAFLLFCRAHHSDALMEYEQIARKFPGKYCVHFRIAELLIIRGDIEEAIISFDKSEEIINTSRNPDVVVENKFRIYNRLAHSYWMMGEEYIDAAIEYINKAESLYPPRSKSLQLNERDIDALANNVCWYHLSKFKTKRENSTDAAEINKWRKLAEEKFKILEKRLTSDDVGRCMLDTAAWFCFNMYLADDDVRQLKKAVGYCREMWDKRNDTSFVALSTNIQLNHIQEIMYHAQNHNIPVSSP